MRRRACSPSPPARRRVGSGEGKQAVPSSEPIMRVFKAIERRNSCMAKVKKKKIYIVDVLHFNGQQNGHFNVLPGLHSVIERGICCHSQR